ncbi:50S ribosomal protein L16 [Candidatus Dependentiae bacterium]|nr:50S ribosomal protein L16 [Candidatus Dependentiae bacterium]
MLMPKKTKYRKVQKGRVRGLANGARTVAFGDYGLIATEGGRITARQIEAIRITMGRKMKKVGELFLRIFPQKPITKKPAEVRMGKGKGSPEYWVAVVKRGRVLCEVKGVDREYAKKVLQSASYKLPLKTKFIERDSS